MPEFPWFPLYVDDWMRATATMTDEQAGAYMRLLCHAWAEGGLPRDETAIRSIGRWSPTAWRRIWPAVAGKWREQDGRLVNPRQERERKGRDAYRELKATAGRTGAVQRWHSHRSANGKPMAQPSPENGTAIGLPMANDSDLQVHVQPQHVHRDSLALVSDARARPRLELSPGQLQAAVPGLVGAWNTQAASVPPFVAVTIRSHPTATAALRAHPELDWWAARLRARGGQRLPPRPRPAPRWPGLRRGLLLVPDARRGDRRGPLRQPRHGLAERRRPRRGAEGSAMTVVLLEQTDAQRVAAMVAAMAELFGVTASPVRIRGYVEALADMPAAMVAEAIRRVAQTWRYPDMPKPGDSWPRSRRAARRRLAGWLARSLSAHGVSRRVPRRVGLGEGPRRMSNALASARQTLAYVRLLEREQARLMKESKRLRAELAQVKAARAEPVATGVSPR